MTLKAAIVGARTANQGTGPWLARFLAKNGAQIVGILGTSQESTQSALDDLDHNFDIQTQGYTKIADLISSSAPDLLVIASPAKTHRQYLQAALESKTAVLCEKPFIWDDDRDNVADATELIQGFKQAKIPLWVNTQWSETLKTFHNIYPDCDLKKVDLFEIKLSPASKGNKMIVEAAPHAWNLLVTLLGPGTIDDLKVFFTKDHQCEILGHYLHKKGQTQFKISLEYGPKQPREFSYTINGCQFQRIIDLKDYSFKIKTEVGIFPINDPVESRIRKILSSLAVNSDNEFIDNILTEIKLLDQTLKVANHE